MASRKEEKERLRREREEAERAAMASESRRKRLAIVLGSVLAVAVAVIVVLAVVSGDDEGANQTEGDTAVPARRITDLDEAVNAAGCKLEQTEDKGSGHTEEAVEYETSPPTSGSHTPEAAQDGVYPDPPEVGPTVHSLEHGRVNVQYKPGTPQNRINQLETMVSEEVQGTSGYKTLLFENQTQMTAAVAATSWTRSLTCPAFNDKVFDAIRAFRDKVVFGEWAGESPEQVP